MGVISVKEFKEEFGNVEARCLGLWLYALLCAAAASWPGPWGRGLVMRCVLRFRVSARRQFPVRTGLSMDSVFGSGGGRLPYTVSPAPFFLRSEALGVVVW